jgi:hypothetical protein
VAILPNLLQREVTQASTLIGGPLQSHHPNHRCVYRIQWHSRTKIIMVHLDRLVPHQGGTRGKQPYRGSSVTL